MSGLANETFAQALDRIFQTNESIAYMAVVDDEINGIAHKGFLDIHPSKLEKLHIQATMLIKMCSLWTDDFGRLNFAGATFLDKYEILAIPLSKRAAGSGSYLACNRREHEGAQGKHSESVQVVQVIQSAQ